MKILVDDVCPVCGKVLGHKVAEGPSDEEVLQMQKEYDDWCEKVHAEHG